MSRPHQEMGSHTFIIFHKKKDELLNVSTLYFLNPEITLKLGWIVGNGTGCDQWGLSDRGLNTTMPRLNYIKYGFLLYKIMRDLSLIIERQIFWVLFKLVFSVAWLFHICCCRNEFHFSLILRFGIKMT